eukprot:TRINITY_DN1159_c0_g3_i1.p1 TRINITY_DN1159_c0_g3~~TRINITY_DN1159_c0_g3_i1.p1  ORF type:complete len:649 (+),score=123.43 TRINITY_DN1159_c0_g3_i1:159-2105(+)
MKNSKTEKLQLLSAIRTRRRLCLTGYPLQNELRDYWTIVNFVCPGFLGPEQQFEELFTKPINDGFNQKSSPAAKQKVNDRVCLLTEKLNAVVLRRDESLLLKQLPRKLEVTVCCRLTDTQLAVYKQLQKSYSERQKQKWVWFRVQKMLLLLGNHPTLLYKDKHTPPCCSDLLASIDDLENAHYSSKWTILFSIIEEVLSAKEKIAVFSHSLPTLALIHRKLNERHLRCYHIDGNVSADARQRQVTEFSHSDTCSVFLLSTKAGGVGINLVAANHLVLFDLDWNPVHDGEAARRAFRWGQTRPVFIYRLVNFGCFEHHLYEQQIHKESLFSTVIDKLNVTPHFSVESHETFPLWGYPLASCSSKHFAFKPTPGTVIDRVIQRHRQLIVDVWSHDLLNKSDGLRKLEEGEQEEAQRNLEEDRAHISREPKMNEEASGEDEEDTEEECDGQDSNVLATEQSSSESKVAVHAQEPLLHFAIGTSCGGCGDSDMVTKSTAPEQQHALKTVEQNLPLQKIGLDTAAELPLTDALPRPIQRVRASDIPENPPMKRPRPSATPPQLVRQQSIDEKLCQMKAQLAQPEPQPTQLPSQAVTGFRPQSAFVMFSYPGYPPQSANTQQTVGHSYLQPPSAPAPHPYQYLQPWVSPPQIHW